VISTICRFWLYLRGITNTFGSRFGKRLSPIAAMVLCGLAISLSVWGDSSTLTISNASVTVTSSASTTLDFPISRGPDTSYDAFVQYQTQDGTAIAGTDYTAASGSIVIPAGTTSATIPVTITGSTSNPADKTFQMLLLGGGGAARTFTPSFAAQQTFATGGDPNSMTEADVNGDGKPDLIVANNFDATVSVLLNTTAAGAATPSFATQQTFATGNSPISVTVADVNGDGKPDLILANAVDSTVSVLINTTAPGSTTASFAAQQIFATGSGPISVTAADVNGDGRPDLSVTNSGDNTVSVLLNTTSPGSSTASSRAKRGAVRLSEAEAEIREHNWGDQNADTKLCGSCWPGHADDAGRGHGPGQHDCR
jgi:trimeric autotransporter adhesin